MRVRLTGQMSGTRDGVPWPPRGSVVDLPDDEAISLCQNAMAVPMARDEVEAAVDNVAEMRAAAAQSQVQDSGGFVVETPDTTAAALTDEELAEQDERDRALVKNQLTALVDETEAADAAEAKNGELADLRAQATALGVKADGRWSAARLREEIAKAQSAQ